MAEKMSRADAFAYVEELDVQLRKNSDFLAQELSREKFPSMKIAIEREMERFKLMREALHVLHPEMVGGKEPPMATPIVDAKKK